MSEEDPESSTPEKDINSESLSHQSVKSMDDDEEEQEGDITWDCCISIFPDGNYIAYNLNHDDEEELGEDFKAEFDKHIDVLSKLQLVIPVEGRDYGILNSRC